MTDKLKQILRVACPALTAALMAGCTTYALMCAMGLRVMWTAAYLPAMLMAAVLAVTGSNGLWTALASALNVVVIAAVVIARRGAIGQLFTELFESGSVTTAAGAGGALALSVSLLMGMLMFLLLRGRTGVPLALIIQTAVIIAAMTGKNAPSLWSVLPGLMAGVAAMASGEDGRGGCPQIVLPAVALAILAILIMPGEGATWKPLEDLATRIRDVAADYTHYTEERYEFSINEKGWNHAAMLGDRAVVMLGGAVNADTGYVMRVDADQALLLRGSVKNTYTGFSWEDDTARSRYLYYNPARNAARNAAFDNTIEASDAGFAAAKADVTMLAEGTSTLFVPTHMTDFSMNLKEAVYYNTAGELFLTRPVAVGDKYSVSAVVPESEMALVRAASEAEQKDDERYSAVCAEYLSLPEGIDSRVYQIADEVTNGETGAAAKAYAIEYYLADNYAYSLDAGAPSPDQDFVSWFMLTEKKGYCSYFASAMAVMCRMVGIPARYVEGYSAPAGDNALTGEDAHAWVEVYLRGIGWTAFDPTARSRDRQDGSGGEGDNGPDTALNQQAQGDDPQVGSLPNVNDDARPSPSPTPDAGDNGGDGAEDEPTPSPSPDPNDAATGDQDENDDPQDPENQQDPQDQNLPEEQNGDSKKNHSRLWWLIIILLILAAAAAGVWYVTRRLRDTDPVYMSARRRTVQAAALTLYRGLLTLLSFAGQTPHPGETPDMFATRVDSVMHCEDYVRFVTEVARSRYAGTRPDKSVIDCGERAYRAFYASLRWQEKLRYNIHRVLHGIGSIDNI